MYTTKQILKVMEDRGYPVFQSQRKDYNLNIIGIRTTDDNSNAFNDFMVVLWYRDNKWHRLDFEITTDPGLYYRKNPINVNGTAILCEGHHRGLWKIGEHRGQYKALVQKNIAKVYRDSNQDEILDMDARTAEEGFFGINCHRANSSRESTQVDRWSAGCQVHGDPKKYAILIALADKAAENWGNSFSYTLLLDNWIDDKGKSNTITT